eukprot:gnl/TRDRNA2_/TRDRNA2_183575_c0_seq1.p1 gnl/TRDRNA2_/TRDRNA2_183575_c0~~gnl/TRDRNA2_/TRDRNA2_183575_c0_seq1.p1  ORF type:complete len:327 (+),score=38.03 gnl/TRDRNA2_/TRDRNA2_183575_c0_seq1:132-983(+)
MTQNATTVSMALLAAEVLLALGVVVAGAGFYSHSIVGCHVCMLGSIAVLACFAFAIPLGIVLAPLWLDIVIISAVIFATLYTCSPCMAICCCRRRSPGSDEETPLTSQKALSGLLGAQAAFDSFFDQCTVVGREMLESGCITSDDVEAQEPALIIGLTAVVTLRALLRSAGRSCLTLADGRELNDDDISSFANPAVALLYRPFRIARDEVAGVKISSEEQCWMEWRLLEAEPGKLSDISMPEESRQTELLRVCSQATGLALDITRWDIFKSRMTSVFEALSKV